MPPGDTIYIPGQTGPPPKVRDPYADSLIRSLWQEHRSVPQEKRPQFLFPQWEMFLFVLLLALVTAYFYIVRPASARKRKIREMSKDVSSNKTVTEIQYDNWLSKFNPYYNSLQEELKKRFLQRTIEFRLSKEFRFHSMQEEEYIPVLISGAAVQVTFGLKNFLMDYYSVINVIRKEYYIPQNRELYYGHVSRESISISWNHFLQGFEDYTDSANVGLHEMAHAVSFDVFLGQTDHHDHAFKTRLAIFQKKGIPVFRAMRQGSSQLLDDYGATNFDEFWAVCVVTFFEKPEEFSRNMPDLYLSVAELLNQDPLKPGKILDKELAGLANS